MWSASKRRKKPLHVVLLQYYRSLLKGNYSLVYYLALGPSQIYVIWSPTHPPIWVLLHIIFLVALFPLGYNNLFFPAFFCSASVFCFSLFNNQHGNSCLEKIIGMLGIAPNLTSVLFWSSELKEHRNLFGLQCNVLPKYLWILWAYMCLNHWSNQQISKREKKVKCSCKMEEGKLEQTAAKALFW